ncbi:hypothetical protein FRC17_004153, partial [Serendipita sp. 399]
PTSPTLGATFARVANSIASSLRSPALKPTDEEIEAEAIRERERSRREAERILTQEAEERRVMEEKILAMRAGARNNSSQTSLPLPQSATQPVPSSYSGNSPRREKEDGNNSGWWQTAKNRLGTSKELTPAQQIIQETKVKDKETKKASKNRDKEPKTPTTKKSSDSANLHLDIPQGGYRPGSSSSAENSPSQERAPSRGYSMDTNNKDASPAARSIKDDNPPVYAKFTPSGALDVHETLLTITRRFEKLERWTVGHVRALEDRVGDVEKWLVDKEEARQAADEAREKEAKDHKRTVEEMKAKVDEIKRIADEAKRQSLQGPRNIQRTIESEVEKAVAGIRLPTAREHAPTENDVSKKEIQRIQSELASIRGDISQIQGKLTEASKATPVTPVRTAEFPRSHSPAPLTSQHTGGVSSTSSRYRLPYPSGDYASGDGITPPSSPPPLNGGGRASYTSPSIPPPNTPSLHNSTSYTSLNKPSQPESSNNYAGLSLPAQAEHRPTSTSPTPRNRKRYTVALGGSLSSPLDQLAQDFEAANKTAEPAQTTEDSPMGVKLIGASVFSRDSPSPNGHRREDTIGGTPIDLARVHSVSPPGSLTSASRMRYAQDSSPGSSRIRAQSAYGAPVGWGSISKGLEDTPPLRPRRRSGDMREGEFGAVRMGTSDSMTGNSSNKFVDPLLLRKKEKEPVGAPKLPVPRGGKANFGDLLAFFDGDRK